MPRKTLDSLSEPMFYVLMALQKQPLCGADIAQWVSARTEKRIVLGPGTLYTILGKLTDAQMIQSPPPGRGGRPPPHLRDDRGRRQAV